MLGRTNTPPRKITLIREYLLPFALETTGTLNRKNCMRYCVQFSIQKASRIVGGREVCLSDETFWQLALPSLAFGRKVLDSLKTSSVDVPFFSSPEHEVLMVSYCGQSMSCVMRRALSTIALKAYSSYTPGPIDLILGRKHRGDL